MKGLGSGLCQGSFVEFLQGLYDGVGLFSASGFQGFCVREGRFRVPGVRAVELRGLGALRFVV